MLTSTHDMLSSLSPRLRPRRLEPVHPGALATDAELCQHWRELDAYFGTETGSPLHHDWRCNVHGQHVPKDHCESCFGLGILKRAAVRMPGSDIPLCAPCARPALQYLGIL